MSRIYLEKGEVLAQQIVKDAYNDARYEESGPYGYISDPRSGKSLSPLVTGPRPAWRWAALMIKLAPELLNGKLIMFNQFTGIGEGEINDSVTTNKA